MFITHRWPICFWVCGWCLWVGKVTAVVPVSYEIRLLLVYFFINCLVCFAMMRSFLLLLWESAVSLRIDWLHKLNECWLFRHLSVSEHHLLTTIIGWLDNYFYSAKWFKTSNHLLLPPNNFFHCCFEFSVIFLYIRLHGWLSGTCITVSWQFLYLSLSQCVCVCKCLYLTPHCQCYFPSFVNGDNKSWFNHLIDKPLSKLYCWQLPCRKQVMRVPLLSCFRFWGIWL